MLTKKTIAIIGASTNEGQAMASLFVNKNSHLLLHDKDMMAVQIVAQRLLAEHPQAHIEAHPCPIDSSWEADIIVLAIPTQDEQVVMEKIREVANQKMVIGIQQYGDREMDTLQKLLPHARIIKAVMKEGNLIKMQSDDKEALKTIFLLMPEVSPNYSMYHNQ